MLTDGLSVYFTRFTGHLVLVWWCELQVVGGYITCFNWKYKGIQGLTVTKFHFTSILHDSE